MRGRIGQHELERAVAALRACLGQLTTIQRRVLILRAGLGPRRALSREQVARRLDLGRAQVRRVEQRGLRRLGGLDGAGRCVARDGVAAAALFGSGAFGGTALAAATKGSAGLARPGSGVKGVSASGGGDDGPSLGEALPPPLGRGSDWTLLILVMAAAMVALLVRRELRRQRQR